MDIIPDFDELGILGYIVPLMIFFGIMIPVWLKVTGINNGNSVISVVTTLILTSVIFTILLFALLMLGCVVYRLDNPG
jgi:hypothetical protein